MSRARRKEICGGRGRRKGEEEEEEEIPHHYHQPQSLLLLLLYSDFNAAFSSILCLLASSWDASTRKDMMTIFPSMQQQEVITNT
jgi:hypothetical protein